jgi:5-methylcytosine-specific restriction endonuclease McrA
MTSFKLKSGTNKGNRRIWIEGDRLNNAGFNRGITLARTMNPDGSMTLSQGGTGHKVAGKDERPIIDLCGKWVTKFMGDHSHFEVTVDGRDLHIRPVNAGSSRTIESTHLEVDGNNDVFVDPAEDEDPEDRTTEGRRRKVLGTRVERSKKLRDQCLDHWGYSCQVCSLNFEERYGSIGEQFIHVHHLNPLALAGETTTDPENDLRPVCPNCHSMLHKKYPPYEIDELKKLMK